MNARVFFHAIDIRPFAMLKAYVRKWKTLSRCNEWLQPAAEANGAKSLAPNRTHSVRWNENAVVQSRHERCAFRNEWISVWRGRRWRWQIESCQRIINSWRNPPFRCHCVIVFVSPVDIIVIDFVAEYQTKNQNTFRCELVLVCACVCGDKIAIGFWLKMSPQTLNTTAMRLKVKLVPESLSSAFLFCLKDRIGARSCQECCVLTFLVMKWTHSHTHTTISGQRATFYTQIQYSCVCLVILYWKETGCHLCQLAIQIWVQMANRIFIHASENELIAPIRITCCCCYDCDCCCCYCSHHWMAADISTCTFFAFKLFIIQSFVDQWIFTTDDCLRIVDLLTWRNVRNGHHRFDDRHFTFRMHRRFHRFQMINMNIEMSQNRKWNSINKWWSFVWKYRKCIWRWNRID